MDTTKEQDVRAQALASTQTYLELLRLQAWDQWIELWADAAILEFPFAPRGRRHTYQGKSEILKYMRGTTKSIVVDGVESVRVHPLLDPEKVIAELVIKGHLLSNHAEYNQSYVTFFEYENGKIKHYREYWNPLVSIYAFGDYDAWIQATADRDGI